MQKFFKSFAAVMLIFSIGIFSMCGAVSSLTPSEFTINPEKKFCFGGNFPLSIKYDDSKAVNADTISSSKHNVDGKIMLFDCIPVKNVNVNFSKHEYVTPCGTPFGIKIYTNGLVVAQISEIKTSNGTQNPAKSADIECGDIITSVNGEKLKTNEQLLKCVENSKGNSIDIEGKRGNKTYRTNITPILDSNENKYKIGLWVKDSCAGIGTLTFIDSEHNTFAGLGHGICDSESGQIMPLESGDIVKANISSIRKSCCGSPGSLCGYFADDSSLGVLKSNSEYGVYGMLKENQKQNTSIPVAFKQEVVRGKAQILTSIDQSGPQYYDIDIENISYNNSNATKNMIIRITDEKLLQKTGGIVQGMSGSPIIQNGMLVGAVTHVFINDPTYGYAIFAENMISFNNSIVQNNDEIAS